MEVWIWNTHKVFITIKYPKQMNNFIKILIFLSLAITNFYLKQFMMLLVTSILFIVNFNSIHNFLNNKKSIQYKIVSSILLIFILNLSKVIQLIWQLMNI